MRKLLVAALVAILGLLVQVDTTYALVNPSILVIIDADGYQSVVETNDQFYIIYFNINYSTPADQPTDGADKTFIIQLNDTSATYGQDVPAAYANDGYSKGLAGFYFAASDTKPTWSDSNLLARIFGNPSLSWDSGWPNPSGITPSYNTASTFEEQQDNIAARIRYLSILLEINWTDITGEIVDVVDPPALTDVGEDYFSIAISSLRNYAPGLYSTRIEAPDITIYGKSTLAADAAIGASSITVDDASEADMRNDQTILIWDGTNEDRVKITGVTGNVVNFTPVLVNAFVTGDAVWVTKQSYRQLLEDRFAGTLIDDFITTGSEAMGMDEVWFAGLFGLTVTLAFVIFFGMRLKAFGAYSLSGTTLIALPIYISLNMALFIPLVATAIAGSLMAVVVVYGIFWRTA